jgi:Disulfide bond formation protein DsbB
VDFVRTFTAVSALFANGLTIALVALLLAVRALPGARRLAVRIGDNALFLGGVVATACVAGSLYYSEVADFIPCRFCWFQRIAMYPLALVLVMGAFTRDLGARRYAVVLATAGSCVSLYHYLLQQGVVTEAGSCDPVAPCSAPYVWEFDFVSIPYMALSGFLLVLALLATTWVRIPEQADSYPEQALAEPDGTSPPLKERSDLPVEESVP